MKCKVGKQFRYTDCTFILVYYEIALVPILY